LSSFVFTCSREKKGQAALILEPLIVETLSQEKSMTLREVSQCSEKDVFVNRGRG
jgi:hypothetical protein